MVNGTEKCVLKTPEGKYVTVRKEREGPRLCALDQQSELFVYIRRRVKDKKNQLAFCFHHKDGNYLPKVDGTGLQLHKLDTNYTASDLPENHWFEKINVQAEYYGLQSVVEPRQYLSLDAEEKKFFCLRDAPQDCKLVKDQLKMTQPSTTR